MRGKLPKERRCVTQDQARPVLAIFEVCLHSTLTATLQKSDTAKAINYGLLRHG
nr:hypothetical protein [Paraburkholderia madseniana]